MWPGKKKLQVAIAVCSCVLLQELFQQAQDSLPSTSTDFARVQAETDAEKELSKLPRPDVTQMLPFKPKIVVRKFHCCGVLICSLRVSGFVSVDSKHNSEQTIT